MKETNSVFDILLFDEKHNLIERIGPFVEDYSDVVELGYSRLSEKKPEQQKPAYFTIEKKFLPFLNQEAVPTFSQSARGLVFMSKEHYMFANDKDSVSVTIDKDYLYVGLAMAGCFIAGGVVGAAIFNDLPFHVGSYIRGFEDGFGVKTKTVEMLAQR